MHHRFNLTFIVLVLISLTLRVNAQDAPGNNSSSKPFLVGFGAFYKAESRKRSAKSDTSSYLADLRLAYAVADSLYLGATYGLDVENIETSGYASASDNSTSELNRQSYGPTFGYFRSNFFSFITYHLNSTWKVSSKGSSTNTEEEYTGTGFQLDVGVILPLGSVSIGPQLSYKTFTYKKLKSNGGSSSSISPAFKDDKLEPQLTIWTSF